MHSIQVECVFAHLHFEYKREDLQTHIAIALLFDLINSALFKLSLMSIMLMQRTGVVRLRLPGSHLNVISGFMIFRH